jgi:hypothetical protein
MKLDPKQDGQEQVVVELNSGRSYFVPREAVERLFRFCPAGASALVARVTPVVDYHLDGRIYDYVHRSALQTSHRPPYHNVYVGWLC